MRRSGSIDETSRGRFRVRIPMPSGKRETVGIYATRSEAITARDAALKLIVNSGADELTVAAWCKVVLTERELSKDIADPDNDWNIHKNHFAGDEMGGYPLRTLRREDVEAWLTRVRKGRSRQTALNVLNLLRVCLRRAVDKRKLKANPAEQLRLPREKRTRETWTYLEPKEQVALIEAFTEEDARIVAFAIGTGLRAGELVALRIEDVHVDVDRPHISVRYGGPPERPTKTGRIRPVPLFGMALHAARAQLVQVPKSARQNPHGLLFPRERGSFRDENHVLRYEVWKAGKAKAGLVRRFRWHDLRHTCASSLVSGWWGRRWTLIEVRDMLGHRSVTTTERYAHLAGTALQEAALATDWPNVADIPTIPDETGDFLNRRSCVRPAPGAPSEIIEDSASDGVRANGQCVASVRAPYEPPALGALVPMSLPEARARRMAR